MRILVLLVALLVVGCKKDKAAPPAPASTAPASTAEQDALWKLAPDGTIVGVVVSSRGIAALDHGWQDVRKLFATAPELAKISAQLDEELTKVFGSANVTLADTGLAPGKGAALFALEGSDELVIVPLGNRDKFLQVTKGKKGTDSDQIGDHTCKTVQGVYACAKPATLLDRVGKGPMDKMKLAGSRGDIEAAGTIVDKSGKMQPVSFAAAMQIQRGGATIRGAVQGVPAEATTRLKAAGKTSVDPAKSAGFAVVNLPALLANAPIPAEPLVPGVTLADLANNIAGPVTVTTIPGAFVFDVRVPMKDTAPAQKLLDQCETLPPLQMLGAKLVNGACHVPVPQLQTELDAWIDGKELRIGKKGAAAPAPTLPPNAVASDLASGEWAIAMYGRGTMLGEGTFPPIPMGAMPDEVRGGIRIMMLLNEVGLGVRASGDTVQFLMSFRTAWSNPDDVVAKLMAIDPEAVLGGKAAAAAKPIATDHPTSPFAGDYKAGLGGVMIPSAALGMLAAVAIPAFMDYTKKSKQTEAMLQLNKLSKNLKASYYANLTFPKGKIGPTPAKSCCAGAGAKCFDTAAWQSPLWKELDFQMDEPHLYRYAYESDGKTYTLRAIGDLDCDGIEVEYVMNGSIDAQGNVTTQIAPPAPNTD